MDGGEALRDSSGSTATQGAGGANSPAAWSFRCPDPSMAATLFEGGKAALAFEKGGGARSEREAFEAQIEELQKVIGEQAVEIRFLKKLSKD